MLRKKAPDEVDVNVGQRIVIARKAAGLSQEKLAEGLGVTFQQVQKYERGANRCAPSRLIVIARRTGKPIAWFYGDDANNPPPNGTDIVQRMLTTTGGVAAATAFVEISTPEKRQSAVNVLRAIAEAA